MTGQKVKDSEENLPAPLPGMARSKIFSDSGAPKDANPTDRSPLHARRDNPIGRVRTCNIPPCRYHVAYRNKELFFSTNVLASRYRPPIATSYARRAMSHASNPHPQGSNTMSNLPAIILVHGFWAAPPTGARSFSN